MRQNEKEWSVFVKRFNASKAAVFRVAEYINREMGLSVTIPAMKLAPDVTRSSNYSDEGDILVPSASGRMHIIDVKHKRVNFTNENDFPFDGDEIMVASVAAAERLPAFAYFIVNNHMTHAFLLRGDTKNSWRKDFYEDKERGDGEEKYLCSIHLGKFVKL